MTAEIRISGPEALPGFVALVEAAADWLWAQGIRQWTPGNMRAKQAELRRKLDRGWLVTAVVAGPTGPDEAAPEIVAGCLLTRLAPPQWHGRTATAAGAAYLERLVVARPFAGRGLSHAIVAACEGLARRHRLDALRLDCWTGNETLKALYRDRGFQEVAELLSQGHRITLFEKYLGGGPRA